MTRTQFFTAQILSKIGFSRTQKRLLDAADEVHLLTEAHEVLGKNVWADLKDSPQYKEFIREIEQLLEEKEKLLNKSEILKDEEITLRDQQNNQFNVSNVSEESTLVQFRQQQTGVAEIKSELAKIKSEAMQIKRQHDEAKIYLDEIKAAGETDTDIITAQEEQINSHKQSFLQLKLQKQTQDKLLAQASAKLDTLSEKIEHSSNAKQDSTVQNFKKLGEKNKEISTTVSRIGIIDNKIGSHFRELGKHISNDVFTNTESKKLIREHFRLCKVIKALRTSIKYNHILGGRA